MAAFPGVFPEGKMRSNFPVGMLGREGSMSGIAKMPGLNEILSDTAILTAIQDPEVMVTFQDVSQKPANMSKYQRN